MGGLLRLRPPWRLRLRRLGQRGRRRLLRLLGGRRKEPVLMDRSTCQHFQAEGAEDSPPAVPGRLQQGEGVLGGPKMLSF